MDIMNDKTETTLGDSLSSAQCLWAGNKVGEILLLDRKRCQVKHHSSPLGIGSGI